MGLRDPWYAPPLRRPPLRLGPWLVRRGVSRAGIDLSDGLAVDLGRLCAASEVGAVVEATAVPVHPDLARLAGELQADPLQLALQGGEDYGLLFTVPRRKEAELRYLPGSLGVRPSRIGTVVPGEVRLRDRLGIERPLRPVGFRHFRRRA